MGGIMNAIRQYHARIIVPANTSEFNAEILATTQEVAPPDLIISIKNITQGLPSIECRRDLAVNAPHVIALAQESESQDKVDGIFVTDFDMCGVEPSREVVNIPIIGGFRASAYTAMMLAQRFSIVTIMNSVIDMQRAHIRHFGIAPNFASIRAINLPVVALKNRDDVIAKVCEESVKAIEQDGADAIILGCTGFVGIAKPVANWLANDGYQIPVLDPNQTAISYLYLLMRNGLSQSRLTYYSPPPRS
jgi:Asp/Glu/hydantoin racemase